MIIPRVVLKRARVGVLTAALAPLGRTAIALVAVAYMAIAPAAAAQGGPATAGLDASLDLGLGLAFGHSDPYLAAPDGLGPSAVASVRLGRLPRGALLAGLNAQASSPVVGVADCVTLPDRSGCAPSFPSISALGLLIGWELRRGERGATLRAAAGPALVAPADVAAVGGYQGRLDVSSRRIGRLAAIGYAHHIAASGGLDLSVTSFGAGLRIR